MTAPHQTEAVEKAIHAAVTLGVGVSVDAIASAASGLLPVTDDLKRVVSGAAVTGIEAAIRHALAALGVSPRVDVKAGPDAVVSAVVHDTQA